MADRKIDIWMYLRSQGVKQGSEEAKRALDSVKASAASLAASLGLVGGIIGAGMFLRTGIREALEAENINIRLRRTIINLGSDYKQLKPQIDSVVKSMAEYAAVDDEDVSGALLKLVQLTGDYTASIKNLKLTLDIAAGAGVDFETAARGMANAIAGNPRGLMEFSAQMRRAVMSLGEGATAADVYAVAMKEFSRYTGAAGDDAASAAGGFRTLGLAVRDLAQMFGELLIQLKTPEIARFLSGQLRVVGNTFGGGLGFYGPNAQNPNAPLPGSQMPGSAVRVNPATFGALAGQPSGGWRTESDIYRTLAGDYGFSPGMPSPHIPGPTMEQLKGRMTPGAITDFFGAGPGKGSSYANLSIDEQQTAALKQRMTSVFSDSFLAGINQGGRAGLAVFGEALKEVLARRLAEGLASSLLNAIPGGGFLNALFGASK